MVVATVARELVEPLPALSMRMEVSCAGTKVSRLVQRGPMGEVQGYGSARKQARVKAVMAATGTKCRWGCRDSRLPRPSRRPRLQEGVSARARPSTAHRWTGAQKMVPNASLRAR